MISSRSQVIGLLFAAGFVTSQSLSGLGLSQQCQDTLTSSLANPEISQCLNVFSAFNIFDADSNASIIPSVDTWLEGICGTASCSNDTLAQAAQNITTGCQTDLSDHGISTEEAQKISSTILKVYSTAHDLVCLSDNSASGTLCVTELLTDLQNIVGTLSINNIVSTAQGIYNGTYTGISASDLKNITCNDCTQAAWAIIKGEFPEVASNSDVTGAISEQCGADFLTGTQPTNILESSGKPSAGAALGSHVTFNAFIGIALVPLISVFAGSALFL